MSKKEARSAQPKPPPIRRRWLLIALVLPVLGLGVYIAAWQLWAEYHFRAAQKDLERRELSSAQGHLAHCLEVWPNGLGTNLLAARTARRARDYDTAEHLLNTYRKLGGHPEMLHLEYALARAQRGELAGLEDYLWGFVHENHEDTPLVLEALAQGYIHAGRWSEALNSLNDLVERWPAVADVYVWRGWVYDSLHSNVQARDDYRKAVELKPEYDDARLRLAETLILDSEFPAAARHLEEIRQRRPDDPVMLLGLARCRIELNQREEAVAHLSRLLALHPLDAAALTQRGRVAVLQGRFDEAENWLGKAVAIAPWERDTNYQLQLCLDQLGKKREALEVRHRLRQLEEQQKRLEELERQIVKEPANRALRYEAAMILLKYGQERAGVRRLQSLLQEDPHNAGAHAALADYFQRKGDTARSEFHRRQGR
jgi:Flp pilus assembly protein TadD